MLALYIIIGILLLLFLLTLFKLTVTFEYSEGPSVRLDYLFFSFTLKGRKDKKSKKKKEKPDGKKGREKKKKSGKEESSVKKFWKAEGLSGFIDILNSVLKILNSLLKGILKHTDVKRLSVSVSAAGDNAADTAVLYGKICTVVYPAAALISEAMKSDDCSVIVNADFDENHKSRAEALCVFRIRVIFLFAAAAACGIRTFKTYIKYKITAKSAK